MSVRSSHAARCRLVALVLAAVALGLNPQEASSQIWKKIGEKAKEVAEKGKDAVENLDDKIGASGDSDECSPEQNEKNASLGVVIGGAAGYVLGDKSDWAIAGGALLGASLAGLFDCEEQAEVSAAVAESLESGEEATTITTSSGKDVEITTTSATEETRKKTILHDERVNVAAAEGMIVDGGYYRFSGDHALRADASPESDALRTMSDGAIAQVMGRLQDGAWLAIGAQGALIGYVPADAVEDEAVASASKVKAMTMRRRVRSTDVDEEALVKQLEEMKQREEEQKKLKEQGSEFSEEVILEAQAITADEVSVTTTCRTVEVSAEGETSTSEFCQSGDGVWEL